MNLRCVLLSFVVLLIAAASTGTVAAQQDPTPGVVKILARGESDGAQREGSGFIVAFDGRLTFIATAAHVIEGDSRPKVVFAAAPHLTYEAIPIQIEATSDIAVLKVIGFVAGTISLPLDERPVAPADPLQAIGFPRRALQPRWSTAGASSREGSRIVLDEQLAEGHSGGPLLREGWVVGLVNSTEEDFSYATSALSLSQILESWRVPFQMQSTRRPASSGTHSQEPEPQGTSIGTRPVQVTPTPAPQPSDTRCMGVIKSLTGASQPVRLAAVPNATVVKYLQPKTQVSIEEGFPFASPAWYRIGFYSSEGRVQGWVEREHIEVGQGCK